MDQNSTPSTFQSLGEFDDCFGVWKPQISKKEKPKSLFQLLSQEVDQISDMLISAKFDKLGQEFLEGLTQSQLDMCREYKEQEQFQDQIDLRFEFLQVDHANLQQVPQFYQQLLRHSRNVVGPHNHLEEEIEYDTNITHLRHCNGEKALILDHIVQALTNQMEKQANIYNSVFLLEEILSLSDLFTLKKCISEELEYNLAKPGKKCVVLVLPATEQSIINFQIQGLCRRKYLFTDPKKMLLALIIELIKNSKVPLFRREVYKTILNSFNLYSTTYGQQVNHIKIALHNFVKGLSPENRDKFTLHLNDKDTKNRQFDYYLNLRSRIKFGIDAVQDFSNKLKKEENLRMFRFIDTKRRIIQFMIQPPSEQSIFFHVLQESDETLNQLLDKFLSALQDQVPNSNQLCKNINIAVNLNHETSRTPRANERSTKIVESAMEPNKKQLNQKQKRLEHQINLFVQTEISNCLSELEDKQSQYVYGDVQSLQDHFSPDILGQFHSLISKQEFNYNEKLKNNLIFTPFSIVRQLYNMIGPHGLMVKASDLFLEIADSEHKKEAFAYCIGELKTLGLLEDTKKVQPTFQKTFFAKSTYQEF